MAISKKSFSVEDALINSIDAILERKEIEFKKTKKLDKDWSYRLVYASDEVKGGEWNKGIFAIANLVYKNTVSITVKVGLSGKGLFFVSFPQHAGRNGETFYNDVFIADNSVQAMLIKATVEEITGCEYDLPIGGSEE